MRRILLIKTSSLGDVVHALPALSDIARHCPDITVDWMVEESFASIPALHTHLHEIIPVAVRRWRKSLLSPAMWGEVAVLRQSLAANRYDMAIDLQGLVKSAWLAWLAPTHRIGYAWQSAREPLATWAYQEKFVIPWNLHAVERNRLLTSQALGYEPEPEVRYGLNSPSAPPAWAPSLNYAVLLHATSRPQKEWPEPFWVQLGQALRDRGLLSVLPSGNPAERARAERLASQIPQALAAPAASLTELAALIGHARCVAGVDTGLTHLAVALERPVAAIFTATRPERTGVYGSAIAINCGGQGKPPGVESVIRALGLT